MTRTFSFTLRRLPIVVILFALFGYAAGCGDYLPPSTEISGGPGKLGTISSVDAAIPNQGVGGDGEGGAASGIGGDGGAVAGMGGVGGLGGSGGVVVMGTPCETCANSMCRCDGFSAEPGRGHFYNLCYEGLVVDGKPDRAIDGRRLGDLRSDLCKAVVDCARKTGCAKGSLVDPVNKTYSDEQFCYCGKVTDMQCLSGKASGACLKEIEDAAESVDSQDIGGRLRDDNFALGRAMNYLRVCDNVICSATCGAPVFETNPAAACPVGGASGAGGTGGAGGMSMSGGSLGATGGFGGSGSGGSLGSGGGGTSGGGGSIGKSSKCLACETTSCDATEAGCSLFEGTRRAACEAWVACIRTPRDNNCVVIKDGIADVQKCYCGTVTDSKCLSGLGNGVCKAEAEKAAELDPCTAAEISSETCAERKANDVGVRFRNPAFPIGPGSNLIYCDFESCNPVCTVPTSDPLPGGTGGVGGTTIGVLANPDFDINTSTWAADASVVLLFNSEDADARSGSGSLDVTNTVFAATVNSISWAGGTQCVAVAPDTTYALAAKAKVPSDRPTGSAGVDVRFFSSAAGCTGNVAFGNPKFTTTPNGAWKDLEVSAKTPADARFMLVRLLSVKAFYEPSLTVRFDKIRLTKM